MRLHDKTRLVLWLAGRCQWVYQIWFCAAHMAIIFQRGLPLPHVLFFFFTSVHPSCSLQRSIHHLQLLQCFLTFIDSFIYTDNTLHQSNPFLFTDTVAAFRSPLPKMLETKSLWRVSFISVSPCTWGISGRFSVRAQWRSPRYVAACLLSCSRGIWARRAKVRGI